MDFSPFPERGRRKNEENPDKKGLMRNNGSRPLQSFPHREIIKKPVCAICNLDLLLSDGWIWKSLLPQSINDEAPDNCDFPNASFLF